MVMVDRIEFKNFKILRNATLPLGPFTLVVGPNASGKSTALDAIERAARLIWNKSQKAFDAGPYLSIGARESSNQRIQVSFHWSSDTHAVAQLSPDMTVQDYVLRGNRVQPAEFMAGQPNQGFCRFNFDPAAIAAPARLRKTLELQPNGADLVIVLDQMRDQFPERFAAINDGVRSWLPDYDHILFDTPSDGMRSIQLRARDSGEGIAANHLSDGTLLALAILTLAHLPDPPSLVAIEEPEHGIHPRLLRLVQDALYRLSFPRDHGDSREPVQVIATTHSPYFLDLFKDHPEEIVIANKNGMEAGFVRLSEQPDIQEILQDAPLGEVWYSGILGGVPANS
jgi:predicted ATPase